ncbi:MAG: histidine N-alpha-methyltransferase [Candidatus Tectimicrobiota bacterium]|nr:MAG: histidine N-alpha-methyltransferase [Candidatus Tectomicrobia bacterium]
MPETHDGRLQLYATAVEAQHEAFARDVARGLSSLPKWLPAKYFYDDAGSRLFEQICALPEYYLYRTEKAILATYAADIAAALDYLPLVELGPGNASKTQYLLAAYAQRGQPFCYCPVDISRTMLCATAQRLVATYPQLTVRALHADFAAQPQALAILDLPRKAIAFLGSSLGNFTPAESVAFLRQLVALMRPGDAFLLGIDLKKSPAVLVPAYDDAQGVTAAFNRNLLERINRELGGHFDVRRFAHVALYNEAEGRIEMHLRSDRAQEVAIEALGLTVAFAEGETIHTENSYKYTAEEVAALGQQAGLRLERTWFDPRRFFLVALFRPC